MLERIVSTLESLIFTLKPCVTPSLSAIVISGFTSTREKIQLGLTHPKTA